MVTTETRDVNLLCEGEGGGGGGEADCGQVVVVGVG